MSSKRAMKQLHSNITENYEEAPRKPIEASKRGNTVRNILTKNEPNKKQKSPKKRTNRYEQNILSGRKVTILSTNEKNTINEDKQAESSPRDRNRFHINISQAIINSTVAKITEIIKNVERVISQKTVVHNSETSLSLRSRNKTINKQQSQNDTVNEESNSNCVSEAVRNKIEELTYFSLENILLDNEGVNTDVQTISIPSVTTQTEWPLINNINEENTLVLNNTPKNSKTLSTEIKHRRSSKRRINSTGMHSPKKLKSTIEDDSNELELTTEDNSLTDDLIDAIKNNDESLINAEILSTKKSAPVEMHNIEDSLPLEVKNDGNTKSKLQLKTVKKSPKKKKEKVKHKLIECVDTLNFDVTTNTSVSSNDTKSLPSSKDISIINSASNTNNTKSLPSSKDVSIINSSEQINLSQNKEALNDSSGNKEIEVKIQRSDSNVSYSKEAFLKGNSLIEKNSENDITSLSTEHLTYESETHSMEKSNDKKGTDGKKKSLYTNYSNSNKSVEGDIVVNHEDGTIDKNTEKSVIQHFRKVKTNRSNKVRQSKEPTRRQTKAKVTEKALRTIENKEYKEMLNYFTKPKVSRTRTRNCNATTSL